jgi:hypothetical protein
MSPEGVFGRSAGVRRVEAFAGIPGEKAKRREVSIVTVSRRRVEIMGVQSLKGKEKSPRFSNGVPSEAGGVKAYVFVFEWVKAMSPMPD